ncbi:hypothetical protein [Paractinoplanes atraurantiacus]|uniref:Lipoprotein n=1 Tax=Paractinoplanes atraurantiacus TaxID=1036182 RepID=A0A285IFM3_9ACTN|nr:hypothetical protein [Actinoplanes atraurantiacus]SNY45741.1 hypothetical protein SAMN05421748_107284 [Actinoplanes atraurantiacus]
MKRRLTAMVALTAIGGCASPVAPAEEPPPVQAEQRARDVLASYEKAVGAARFVPAGGLTGSVGSLEQANEHYKAAIGAGRIEAAAELPVAPRATGTVIWAGGERLEVPLIGAGDALGQVMAEKGGECLGCTPVPVTGAKLTTTRIPTTRGEATVPAWEFTLKGSAFRITRVAVAPSGAQTYTPPPGTAGGPAAESATVSGRTVTVKVTGSRSAASEPCGADYTARAVESAHAVVVIVDEHRHAANEICPMIGFPAPPRPS